MAAAMDGGRTSGEGSAERGLLDYLRILWRHKLVIALTIVVAVGAAVGLDHFRTRTYQASAQVLFTSQGASGVSSSSDLSPADVATDIELIQSAPVQAAVAKTLQTTAPPATATEVGTTNVAQISVRSTSPAFAAAAANAYARAYIQVATQGYLKSQLGAEQQIQTQILGTQSRINTILQTPGSATSPRFKRNSLVSIPSSAPSSSSLASCKSPQRRVEAPGSSSSRRFPTRCRRPRSQSRTLSSREASAYSSALASPSSVKTWTTGCEEGSNSSSSYPEYLCSV